MNPEQIAAIRTSVRSVELSKAEALALLDALEVVQRERDALRAYVRSCDRLVGFITVSDCYKHIPDQVLKDARDSLARARNVIRGEGT